MDVTTSAQLTHNEWATRELVDACSRLEGAGYRQEFAIGLRTLERTLAHIVDVMYYIGDGLAGRAYVERADLEEGSFSPDELHSHLNRAAAELREAATGTSSAVEFPLGSGRWVERPVLLSQLFDHGSHHRAQGAFMLRQLGVAIEVHPLRWAGVDPGDEGEGAGPAE